MSQIGLKALKVLGGAESPNDTTAQLSEAWLNKIRKINEVADNMESKDGLVKSKKTTPMKKQQTQQRAVPILEQKEKQVPITEILARAKTEKLGIPKKQVSPDDIMALLSGNRPQPQIPIVENKKIETQYQNFIKEAKQYTKEDNIIDDDNSSSPIMNQNANIKQMVTEEVTRILFKEIFSKNRLKEMMESVFRDVIKEKAKEILFETLQRRKAQGK
jgi:hypothetical protein